MRNMKNKLEGGVVQANNKTKRNNLANTKFHEVTDLAVTMHAVSEENLPQSNSSIGRAKIPDCKIKDVLLVLL